MTETKYPVFLPTTPFPMRGDLPQREPELLARWNRIRLWDRTVEAMRGRPPFVLHDGPIYSNGHLHIGHALNRILKDVVMRAHRMAGENVGYIPGWDTHGCRSSGRSRRSTGPASGTRTTCRCWIFGTSAVGTRRIGWRCRRRSSSGWA